MNGKPSNVRVAFPAGEILRRSAGSHEELEHMAAFWNLKTVQLSPGSYRANLEILHTANSQLALVSYSVGTRFEGSIPDGTTVLSWPASSVPSMQLRGLSVGNCHLMVQHSRDGLDFSFLGAADILTLAVVRSELIRRLQCLWQLDPERIVTGLLPFRSPGAAVDVIQEMRNGMAGVRAHPAGFQQPAANAAFESSALDVVLSALKEPRPPETGTARRWLARRAAMILRERCREDISIADLCQAVGASRRTLHLGFLELYGLPPMRYLRALRLSGARREIGNAGNDRVHITEIATAWGFNHLGRFSAYYRDFFGMLPSNRNDPSGPL